MGIRRKVIILVGATVIVLMMVVYMLINSFVVSSFLGLEREQLAHNALRLDGAVNANLNNLDSKVADWGRWDDAYNFVLDGNQEFIDSNLGAESLRSLGVDMMVFLANDEIIFSRLVDNTDSGQDLVNALPDNLSAFVRSEVMTDKYDNSRIIEDLNISHGIIKLPDGEIMISYGPIIHSDGQGPVVGVVLFGQWIDQDFINQLSSTIQLQADINDDQAMTESGLGHTVTFADKTINIDYLDDNNITGSFALDDVIGDSVIRASVSFPRSTYQEVRRAVRLFFFFYLLLSVVIFILIIFIIEFFILRRFVTLNNELNKIHLSGVLNQRINLTGRDEFANLGYHIDSLLNDLERSHQDISERDIKLAAESKRVNKQNKDLEKVQLAMLNLLEDIDQEKSAVEKTVEIRTRELSAERAKLAASISSLPLGFAIIDQGQSIATKNEVLTNIFAVDGGEVTLHSIHDRLGEEFDILTAISQAISQRMIVTKDDISIGVKFIKIFLAPIIDVNDNVLGCLMLVEDTTEHKMMERTREEFFAVASHELRTPLTAIRGNMSIIRDFILPKVKDKDLTDMVNDSYNGAIRLISIVNDFLDASRLEQGRVSFKLAAVDLGVVVTEVVQEMNNLAVSKGLKLKMDRLPADLPLAKVDRDRIKQVVFNLVGNAINYTVKGTVTIRLSQAEGKVKVSVSDTGPGISEQNQTRLFKKFQQAQESVLARDVTKSTGLGLYISKILIDSMGGNIWLEETQLGKGTTFSFLAPIANGGVGKV